MYRKTDSYFEGQEKMPEVIWIEGWPQHTPRGNSTDCHSAGPRVARTSAKSDIQLVRTERLNNMNEQYASVQSNITEGNITMNLSLFAVRVSVRPRLILTLTFITFGIATVSAKKGQVEEGTTSLRCEMCLKFPQTALVHNILIWVCKWVTTQIFFKTLKLMCASSTDG